MSALKARKMALVVFSPRSITHSKAGGAEIYIHEILNRVSLKGFYVLIVSSSDRKIRGYHNYREAIVSKSEFSFPFLSLKSAKYIRCFDIIIENVSKFPIMWPLLLSRILRKPFVAVIHHIHGITLFKEVFWPAALILYLYELLSLKLYSLLKAFVVTVSESTKQELMKIGFSGHQIFVVKCGLNLSIVSTQYSAKSKEPLITYVGRVKEYKRIEHLVAAMSIVRRVEPNVRCIVAGKGDEKVYKKLWVLANKLGLGDTIEFDGEISEERKFEILKSAWLYVITSMKEGFGISVLEAQAFGVPVVGYKVAGVVDAVKDRVTGLLVPDGDIKALANTILTLIRNEELRNKMSSEAKTWASEFNWSISAEKFLETLKDLLAGRLVNE